jgi:hypothetical protein
MTKFERRMKPQSNDGPMGIGSLGHSLVIRISSCVILAALAGCNSGLTAYPSDDTATLSADAATDGRYPISIDDLAGILPDVVAAMEWAVVRTRNDVTALRADLVTADDRPIEVHAQQVGRPTIAVQIRYGRFGNADKEAAFHQALAARIEQLQRK